jgi:hypothetical protein
MLKKSLLALTLCLLISIPFVAFAIAPNDPQSDQTSSIIPEVWNTYYTTSNTLRHQDEIFLAEELQRLNQKTPELPTPTKEFGFDINQPIEWFASAEGKRIMEIILSFQTPSGGW